MRAGFGTLRHDRIDARLLEPTRLFDRGRSAGNKDVAPFEGSDLRRGWDAKNKAEFGRSLLQHGLQLLLERIARQRRQDRRRQTEPGMRFGHNFEHRLRVDIWIGCVAAGKQMMLNGRSVICRRRRIAAAMSSGLE